MSAISSPEDAAALPDGAAEFAWKVIGLLREHASSVEARGAIFLATQTVAAVALIASDYHGALRSGASHGLGIAALAALVIGMTSAGETVLPGRNAIPDWLGLRPKKRPPNLFDGLQLPLPEIRTATADQRDEWIATEVDALRHHLLDLYSGMRRAALATGLAALLAGVGLLIH